MFHDDYGIEQFADETWHREQRLARARTNVLIFALGSFCALLVVALIYGVSLL